MREKEKSVFWKKSAQFFCDSSEMVENCKRLLFLFRIRIKFSTASYVRKSIFYLKKLGQSKIFCFENQKAKKMEIKKE